MSDRCKACEFGRTHPQNHYKTVWLCGHPSYGGPKTKRPMYCPLNVLYKCPGCGYQITEGTFLKFQKVTRQLCPELVKNFTKEYKECDK